MDCAYQQLVAGFIVMMRQGIVMMTTTYSTVIPPMPAGLPDDVEIVHHQNDRHKIISRKAYLRGAKTRYRHWQLAAPQPGALPFGPRAGPSLPQPVLTFLGPS